MVAGDAIERRALEVAHLLEGEVRNEIRFGFLEHVSVSGPPQEIVVDTVERDPVVRGVGDEVRDGAHDAVLTLALAARTSAWRSMRLGLASWSTPSPIARTAA